MEYAGDFPDLPAGEIVVRILLLLWTGDYPAQCEVGKFIKGGKQACRRDKVTGINPNLLVFHLSTSVLVLRDVQTLARHTVFYILP